MGYTVKETDFKQVEEGTYSALLESMEDKTFTYEKDGQSKSLEKVLWVFKITEGEFKGRKVRGETFAEIDNHPNNKFRGWVEAILDTEISVGFHFTQDDLVGLPCRIAVKHRTYNDKTYENVDQVFPAEGRVSNEVPF